MTEEKIERICNHLLEDIAPYKLVYALDSGMLRGAFDSLIFHYEVPKNKETLDIFIDCLSRNLTECDVEFEYTEEQWEKLQKLIL